MFSGSGVKHNRVDATPLMDGITRSEEVILLSSNLKRFTFNELKTATLNFHPDNKFEVGDFGPVFKGWIEEKGTRMAIVVKRLSYMHIKWMKEIKYLGKMHNPNIIRLIGYYGENYQRMLVYEFMPNESLAKSVLSNSQPLSWNLRMKAILGVAKGLAFLHDGANRKPIIIHRNVKCSNVLLDSDYNAKLFNFGLALDGPAHFLQTVVGLIGYGDPDFAYTGRVTSMFDVYSFGVVLLEMLCGRLVNDVNRAQEEKHFVRWAKPFLIDEGKILCILDPRLEWGKSSLNGAQMVASLALWCASTKVDDRPSMDEVVEALEAL